MTTEFESASENRALKQAIIERIQRDGPISFRDYMEMVLYQPALGYYTSEREKMGREGDYLTSPEVSPLFGAMMGRQLREMWEVLGRPASFDAIEVGAGNGTLARDILSWSKRTAPELAGAMRYSIVEISEALVSRQRARLEAEGLASAVEWRSELPEGWTGCIFANELLDAMPTHRVRAERGELREVIVTWDGNRFGEELAEPNAEVSAYFERLGIQPGEGCYAEVNVATPRWMTQVASGTDRGFLMLFDYGYEAPELYASWRKDGTLLCFYKHNPSADPYARIGRQDMTAHVDFTTVRRSGEAAGLRTLGFVTQSEFLANLGIGEALAPPKGGELEEHFRKRRAVMDLLDPGGLGRIKVLVQGRGVDGVPLRGFASVEV